MLPNTSKLITLCPSPAPAGLHVCSPDLEFTARGSSLAQSADVVQGEPLHTLPAQCPACPASCHHSTCFVTPQAGLSGAPAKPQSQVRPPGPHLGTGTCPFGKGGCGGGQKMSWWGLVKPRAKLVACLGGSLMTEPLNGSSGE